MEYTEYVNFLIENSDDYKFVVNIVNDKKYYQVYFKDPDTGRTSQFIHFTIEDEDIIDYFTNTVVGDSNYLDLDDFEELAKQ